ncbi:MAG TPA: hypothetical protein VI461_17675, partial [Chitinophagaceae bacterium]|nr:hypothetical protein [Chitinophagaceae bacterium]
MRKILLTLTLSFLFLPLLSQDSLLKSFKFRNVNYRAMTFEAYGSGGYANTDYTYGKNKTQTLSGSLGTTFYMVKSNDKILLNASGGFYISQNAGKNENTSGENKYRSFRLTPQFSVLNKWFSRKFFTELGVDARTGFSFLKDIFSNPSNTIKNNEDNYSLSVTAGIGKGRLENITDMQNALWLYDALQKESRLSRPLSAGELNGLGQAIIKANNTRVLDSRKRTQFLLETADDYLQQNALINKTDIRYFSGLNDILFFAINYNRLSGTEKYIRLTPALIYQNQEQSQTFPATNNDSKSTVRSARLSAGFSRYSPVNLRHQNNYGISIYGNYAESDYNEKYFASGTLVNEIKIDPILRQMGINLFFEHAIYPNTRTVISLNLRSDGGYEKTGGKSLVYGYVNFYGALNYFISYRTRFTGTLCAMYQQNA